MESEKTPGNTIRRTMTIDGRRETKTTTLIALPPGAILHRIGNNLLLASREVGRGKRLDLPHFVERHSCRRSVS
jgi:hypothetical protein